ncbi:uncharacterized protein Z520_05648 [Fonsecaea multimorphosa CBS 102226]|uniref:MARVEL domain-containing protein n=1 Tax=Fonsecaea multimorphosa CBS 102226 TaxID=1442371 RepID=A0A0D2JXU4_9EURO|nr:uncharacterized protein Z520_05648 [Fonsecaea multimorphosa CBS 102226]KIX98347.1 hypothetical protein Z520_05648 [Fonsecaea multimorphosa CBS 102226]OAL24542.1 hypothetical protein AYO22_05331 [Fonsecaea multimorphosa]
MKSRPQVYPRLSFHLIRAVAFVSASIVSGILIYFCMQLRHDGFKLPWTFIIVLASSLLSLLSLVLTSFLHTCFFLSPLFNLILNVTVFILWVVGYGLLTWNMYGTLGHSCSRANWASDDGMMICRIYKALYSFEVFGLLAQIALIVLDVRTRRAETKLGKYNQMGGPLVRGGADVKLDDLNNGQSGASGLLGGHQETPQDDGLPYGIGDYNESRLGLRDHAAADITDYSNHSQSGRVRMDDFNDSTSSFGYNAYAPHTGYANGGYGYEPQR